MAKRKYFIVSSLEKSLKIIELLAQNKAMSVTQLAKSLKTDTSSSHRFLSTLRELGYAEKNRDGQYQLTFKILEHGLEKWNEFFLSPLNQYFGQFLKIKDDEKANLLKSNNFNFRVKNHQTQ